MGDWPLSDGQGVEGLGANTAASTAVSVQAAGSSNTKGSWVELTAATVYPASGMIVNIGRGHTSVVDALVDIGFGGSGSEQVVVPNLVAGTGSSLLGPGQFILPIGIPAGTRISARCQATTANAISRVQVFPVPASWLGVPPLGRVTDYGINTADSGGVQVDPGGTTAHTKGAWAQITASTTQPMRALIVAIGNQANSSRGVAYDWLLDIGIGGSGSEVVILPDWQLAAAAADDVMWPRVIGPIPVNIPAGTRIAARSQCSQFSDATDRVFDVIIYGID